jgi:CubicO group peptidase (beta-lactamase class C family)
VVQHNGGINGFNSFLSYYPESRITIAVLANLNGPAADQLGPQLGAIAHGDPIAKPQ